MKLFTYTGETPDEALRQAKSVHGSDPFILKSREIRKKTLSQKGLYEIVIAVEEQNEEPAKNSVKKKLDEIAQKSFEKKKQDQKISLSQDMNETIRHISEIAGVKNPSNPYVSQKQKPQMQESEDLRAIKKEIEQIDDRLKLIQSMFWEEKKPNHHLNIPQEFAEIYGIAKNSGIDSERLNALMELTLELMPLQMRSNSVTVKRYFREVLRKMIACRSENLEIGSKNILMFVGPTGVGKTTTLAKLAARYSLMLDKRYKVGVITLDSYKIAAMEQLMTYARMMRLGIERVDDPSELEHALDRLKYCDFILIDTAGHSQYDKQKLEMLKSYMQNDFHIEVSLVLSAGTKYEDLRDIYQSFSAVEIDNLIFSKLDESRSFGNIFSLACDVRKPISYFSVGQSVPNDLLVASNEFLVDCLLDGFKKPQKDNK
ncbi:flagellar biosynthesis protein FlhF [Helicobacter kayseriensis]|uniref:flagellar biosynthesis protein FlhF n=1 Tax=Helicobacter kayseriensis TaxID=2905877 RepID=UPI001E500354|nr:flagellar biosynthesis protein FlhF [Helicobacter kayseriensis]MCE3046921.1 flagellar biosynthesis protein FlhF [Helicobacter kayseriensis]MCE3048419.1 flagellar biosynthesis protein FlhF [Helicobacter kayseriensis]